MRNELQAKLKNLNVISISLWHALKRENPVTWHFTPTNRFDICTAQKWIVTAKELPKKAPDAVRILHTHTTATVQNTPKVISPWIVLIVFVYLY
jgi:hypothetical protein